MNRKTKDHLLFLLGVAICFAVAGISVFLEERILGGLLGASIIALFMGTIINSFFHPDWLKPALKFWKKVLHLIDNLPFRHVHSRICGGGAEHASERKFDEPIGSAGKEP